MNHFQGAQFLRRVLSFGELQTETLDARHLAIVQIVSREFESGPSLTWLWHKCSVTALRLVKLASKLNAVGRLKGGWQTVHPLHKFNATSRLLRSHSRQRL